MRTFRITREDGRSNGQVLLDYVRDKPAGTTFTYAELAEELSRGSNHVYTERDVQALSVRIYPRLLKEQARALHNVRNVGYRLAPAALHVTLANNRRTKADKQMLRGLQTLEHVRWEEMDTNQRLAHEGQLMIVGALYHQMRALEQRTGAVEQAISRVMSASK